MTEQELFEVDEWVWCDVEGTAHEKFPIDDLSDTCYEDHPDDHRTLMMEGITPAP